MTAVGYTVDAGIAVLDFGNPPVNALGHALRRELAAMLDKANDDANVKALVLIGRADTFSAGADIREFNSPAALAPPALPQLIDAFESSPKPVVAWTPRAGATCVTTTRSTQVSTSVPDP